MPSPANLRERNSCACGSGKQRAKEIGIKGRSTMSKAALIKALRDH